MKKKTNLKQWQMNSIIGAIKQYKEEHGKTPTIIRIPNKIEYFDENKGIQNVLNIHGLTVFFDENIKPKKENSFPFTLGYIETLHFSSKDMLIQEEQAKMEFVHIDAELTPEQEKEVLTFIKDCNYDFGIKFLLEEYKKWNEYEYISHSYKKVIEEFPSIFVRF